MKENYELRVKQRAKDSSPETFFNDGPDDAAIVFENIFNYTDDEVLIFTEELNAVVCSNPKFVEALEGFLSSGKSIKVILQKNIKSIDSLHEPLSTILKLYSITNPEQVQVKHAAVDVVFEDEDTKRITPIHFTVSGNMYRKEYDITKFSAECCFFDTVTSNGFKKTFYDIFNDSNSVNIPLD